MKKSALIVIKDSEITDEVLVCPYCMSDVSSDQMGCCGESSAHFERAVVVGNEAYLESDIRRVDDDGNCLESF